MEIITEIVSRWYRVSYAFPSLHWFRTILTILTEGGCCRLYYTLPVLLAWVVVVKYLSPLATRRRVGEARKVFRWYSVRDAIGGPH
jgi:hypothetical protein